MITKRDFILRCSYSCKKYSIINITMNFLSLADSSLDVAAALEFYS